MLNLKYNHQIKYQACFMYICMWSNVEHLFFMGEKCSSLKDKNNMED